MMGGVSKNTKGINKHLQRLGEMSTRGRCVGNFYPQHPL